MTLSLLNHFNVSISYEKDFERFHIKSNQSFQNTTYAVEGDWSSASLLLVAGAIGGKVTVRNLQTDSLQADKQILEVLESADSRMSILNDTVTVERGQLESFEFDATQCPDLFPSLVVLACNCRGKSLIKGVERLRHKESDRAQALKTEFTKVGAKINIDGNLMEIEGTQLKGGIIDSHNDHRIAMAGAIAALSSEKGIGIQGWQSVSKSYPDFFEDLKSIGGEVE
jgi:3-phosphoshikimate 1-carboxyvinyltransferase